MLGGRKAVQRSLDRLDPWTEASCIGVQWGRVLGPAFGSQQSRVMLQAGVEWLESCPVEKGLV